jgi:hypothetical protein
MWWPDGKGRGGQDGADGRGQIRGGDGGGGRGQTGQGGG